MSLNVQGAGTPGEAGPSSSGAPHGDHSGATQAGFWTLALGSVGVVYGDIGTSVIYAFREALHAAKAAHGEIIREDVVSIISLILWTLTIIVTLKYVVILLRADNNGEGGTLSLMALAGRAMGKSAPVVFLLGVAGAALFYGDAVITPAISVLSAMEGLKVAAPALEAWVLPASVAIILLLFALQKRGTARVGRLFGPVILVWLLAIGLLGIASLRDHPQVLAALDPRHALGFFLRNGVAGFTTLGAVVLVLTGAEALYADMGHFGARPIRLAWFVVALPCLLASYFGQGALLLADPAAASGPFYRMVPAWALLPMIVLATAATVIASQAVISGAYSMARLGMALDFLPRMQVRQTSALVRGQIHVPVVSGLLLVLVLAALLGFRSSSALAASFGIAVSGTMLMTTVLVLLVAWQAWRWPLRWVIPLGVVLLGIDLAYFGANLLKLGSGGWFPLALGSAAFTLMLSWRQGRLRLLARLRGDGVPLATVLASLHDHPPHRVAGTAVFLTRTPQLVPQALLHNLKHNKVLHACNVLMTVEVLDTPQADPAQRITIEPLGDGFHRLHARFGFAEDVDVPAALERCAVHGLAFDLMQTTFFSSREHIADSRRTGLPGWRDRLFALLARNAVPATTHYRIPDNRLIEIGRRIAL